MISKWDLYFMRIAREVASNSKCLSRKIGAVVTVNNRIVATGYNGPPSGVSSCDKWSSNSWFGINTYENPGVCPRRTLGYGSGQGLEYCVAGHAERNCLLSAAKMGVSVDGGTLYGYCPMVCKDCAVEIINAGIKRVVTLEGPHYDKVTDHLFREVRMRISMIPLEALEG